jgi:hypothetical protein
MSAFHNIDTPTYFEEISAAFQTGLYNHGGSTQVDDGDNEDIGWHEPHQEQNEEIEPFDFQVSTSCFEFSFDQSATSTPLCDGSPYSAKDVCRFLLHMKNCNAVIGDRLFASIVGSIAALLPEGNVSRSHVSHIPSMYNILKLVSQYADLPRDVKVLKIPVCKNGCRSFRKDIAGHNCCPDCGTVRWECWSQECLSANGQLQCKHEKKVSGEKDFLFMPHIYMFMTGYVLLCRIMHYIGRSLFYLSVRERITKLLRSTLHNMFYCELYRYKSTDESFVEDIFDSTTYRDFKSLVPNGGNLIFLQVCWDGADMFNYSGKSMWSLCYSIMNFPFSLRDSLPIGMHMAAFDDGSMSSLAMFAEECLDLWLNPIECDGKQYYVAVGQLLMDDKSKQKRFVGKTNSHKKSLKTRAATSCAPLVVDYCCCWLPVAHTFCCFLFAYCSQ